MPEKAFADIEENKEDVSLSALVGLYLAHCDKQKLNFIWSRYILPYLNNESGEGVEMGEEVISFYYHLEFEAVVNNIRIDIKRKLSNLQLYKIDLIEFDGFTSVEADNYIEVIKHLGENFDDLAEIFRNGTIKVKLKAFLWLLHRGEIVEGLLN